MSSSSPVASTQDHPISSHSNGTRHKSRSSRRSNHFPATMSMDHHDIKHRAPHISKQAGNYHLSRSDEREYPPAPASVCRTSTRSNASSSRGNSLTRHNSGGGGGGGGAGAVSGGGSSGPRGAPIAQLGRSNSGSNYSSHSPSSTKHRNPSNGSSTPPSRAGMGSPTSISSRTERLKRRPNSTGGDDSPQRNLSPAGSKAHFDMKHMHRSIDAVVEEVRDASAPSGLRSPIEKQQQQLQQVVTPAAEEQPSNVFGTNGARSSGSDPKKERYRSLWGKAGKQQPAVRLPNSATSTNGPPHAESGGAPLTPTSAGPNPKKKWDMVLNPLVQRQKEKGGKSGRKLMRKSSQLEAAASYLLQQAEQEQHQQYMHQAMAQQQINSMNAPNQSTTQCDCGDDSCPFCNLMLNMEMTDPNMLM